MGVMTEVSILNDRWYEIRQNPQDFVEQLMQHSLQGTDRSYIVGQTTVAPSHHADDIRVYFSGRNSFFDAFPKKGMSVGALERHLKYLKEMKGYIKIAENATKRDIAEQGKC